MSQTITGAEHRTAKGEIRLRGTFSGALKAPLFAARDACINAILTRRDPGATDGAVANVAPGLEGGVATGACRTRTRRPR